MFKRCLKNLQSDVKNFLEAAMFCHLAVLISLCPEVKNPRYMQNKKDLRISLFWRHKMLSKLIIILWFIWVWHISKYKNHVLIKMDLYCPRRTGYPFPALMSIPFSIKWLRSSTNCWKHSSTEKSLRWLVLNICTTW